MNKKFKKVTFELPVAEYIYLKMTCAKQSVSMKEFLTHSIIKSLHAYEDILDIEALRKAKEEDEIPISWEEARTQISKVLK